MSTKNQKAATTKGNGQPGNLPPGASVVPPGTISPIEETVRVYAVPVPMYDAMIEFIRTHKGITHKEADPYYMMYTQTPKIDVTKSQLEQGNPQKG